MVTSGIAFSLMIAMILSSILAMHWLERYIVKYIINSSLAVFVGVLLAYSSGAVLNTQGVEQVTIGFIVTDRYAIYTKKYLY